MFQLNGQLENIFSKAWAVPIVFFGIEASMREGSLRKSYLVCQWGEVAQSHLPTEGFWVTLWKFSNMVNFKFSFLCRVWDTEHYSNSFTLIKLFKVYIRYTLNVCGPSKTYLGNLVCCPHFGVLWLTAGGPLLQTVFSYSHWFGESISFNIPQDPHICYLVCILI